ncbi:MAG: phosphoenolpyruvate synthase [Deltaproteobacteria bacterium]|nr:phosphoenolpyruvate synthase [Deltaproteobacteria bacterium]
MPSPLVLPFSSLTLADVPVVGGKNASLGEMVRSLSPKGVRVPDGFATTSDAFRSFLAQDGLRERIARFLVNLDTGNADGLARVGRAIRDAILATPLPADLARAVVEAYRGLGDGVPGGIDVAVRSSATAEDLPDASFAGQQETFLNVCGEAALLDAVRRCMASLYTDRAISYRVDKGFAHDAVALSVGVQRMVRADLACSGVMFSIDTETGFPDVVLVTGAWGLGETVVQGAVNPDEFVVFKPALARGLSPILQKSLGAKELKMVYATGGTRGTRTLPAPAADRARFVLDDEEVLTLARWACVIEDHYSSARGDRVPMDMEWAKDGRTGELFIVQARPETVVARRDATVLERWVLDGTGETLLTGRSVGDRVGSGPARAVTDVHHLGEFRDGEVLVADRTDPDWEPIMKKAAAIVTSRGGRTCHAAIVSRELGIPAVVGVGDTAGRVGDGDLVTVACDRGDEGRVLRGAVPFHVERTPLGEVPRPRTRVMMNVGNPAEAFRLSRLPSDGVGLARLEFIVSNWIGVHPRALLEYGTLHPSLQAQIAKAARGFVPGPGWFVERLAQGVGTIAAAFFPRPVIVRLSDFKTNEYAHLLGGEAYEPREENPMIGFRGASRYYDPRYRDAFALECQALRRVRQDMGLANVVLMVPFCRTPEEGRLVLAEMARHGLERGRDGLEVYVMCELPSNVELATEFAEVFDGFSIGSNDLTQLILGVDRDSELVARLFDERNPAVTRAIARVIRAAHDSGRKIGICGQAPSDHPEFLQFLVEQGIDSISLNPDTVLRGTLAAMAAESAPPPGTMRP